MHQKIGRRRFFQRRAEGRDEFRRQFSDEPDGVRKKDDAAGRKLDAPGRGIERREKFIVGIHVMLIRFADARAAFEERI